MGLSPLPSLTWHNLKPAWPPLAAITNVTCALHPQVTDSHIGAPGAKALGQQEPTVLIYVHSDFLTNLWKRTRMYLGDYGPQSYPTFQTNADAVQPWSKGTCVPLP